MKIRSANVERSEYDKYTIKTQLLAVPKIFSKILKGNRKGKI